ncbi:hypothetical protein C0J52_08839 [Blattella germanica]|nr:hypothetical protein C0J52_08839 [Blattella germanica]
MTFIIFSFSDGLISEVCPHENETNWVLNFKRGILSAFQNTMKRFDVDHHNIDVDINGNCQTDYTLQGARETSLVITRKKDITSCTHRYKHHSILQTTPYLFRNNYHPMPIMKSSSVCEMSVDHYVYNKIICEDVHLFQPFSSKESGAQTVTKQVLTLVTENNSTSELPAIYKRHVLDALPMVGTNAGIAVMKDIILKNGVTKDVIHEWMFIMSFTPRPDLQTISTITPLLKWNKADAQFYLSVSAIVHTYCKWNSNCQEELEVSNVISFLENQVQHGCQRRDNKNGNVEKLIDTELRIASYLEAMKCPTYLVIKTIKHSLNEEEVNQVGSFVWSHLNNLLKSSSPSKVEIQALLQDKDLVKKFRSDMRKYSHNYEGSMFFENYNLGGSYESNLIFSPKSYLPRSASLNLTVDLFGESVNVLEVAGRMEGFEHYIESIFGPKGPFSSTKVKEGLEKLRVLRSTPEDLKSKVDELPNVVDSNFDDPKLSLAMKIFGNELRYHKFSGNEELNSAWSSINPVEKIKQLLSGQEINYNKAGLFLDTSYIIPTSTGLPISLSAVGTAAVNLQMSGSLKAANFLKTYEMDVEGKVRPSVAIDVVATMGVDAYYASTGIKLRTNMHSSSAVEGQLKVRGAKLVSLNFNLPKEKIEIINARSELIVMHGDKEEYQSGNTEDRVVQHTCSWPTIDRTLGLNFCADLVYPNISQINTTSQFIFSGPTKFSLAMKKADPTAKKYLLEYKWETSKDNMTIISFVFDTPDSKLKRELSAKLYLDMNSQNLTLLLQSSRKYKNMEKEKYLQFGLNIDGKRHFDAELGLKIKDVKYGHIYQPRLYLAINNERIAELSGTLKWIEKKGVSQCDVNLEFNTKKVWTKLFGYIRKSEASVSTNLKLEYKFPEGDKENVKVEAELSNRSKKQLVQAIGNLQLESSQYSQFNFIATLNFARAAGHIECKIEVNAGPKLNDERNKLTIQLVFKYNKTPESCKLNTYLEITKPLSDINISLSFYYVNKGSDHKAVAKVQYTTGKEVVVTVDVTIPRGSTLFIDARLNVTIPSFTHSMLLEFKLHEKTSKDYDIEISGTWFSGHTFTAKGFYQDRSTTKVTAHVLKMFVKSPSFNEIDVSCKFYSDDREFKFEFQADHNDDRYSMLFKHSTPTAMEYETYIEFRYRDIHMSLKGVNLPDKKEAGIEIKWDANRDPGQKFAASIDFANPERLNYSGSFLVAYPGRIVKGNFYLALKGTTYKSFAHLEWSPKDVIEVTVVSMYNYGDSLLVRVNCELLTPFENWKRTSIAGGVRQEGNLFRANGSVYWQDDQNIAVDFFGDYMITDTDFQCEVNASILSTIPQVSSMSGSLYHKQTNKRFDTNVHVQYYPEQVISLKSTWEIEQGSESSNLTGHFKKITNCMLEFNITTPFHKYGTITGRFGYSEMKRHLVAQVKGPNGGLGIEILLSIVSTNDFDVKFILLSPMEFMQEALVIAKLKKDEVDFRLGWNALVLGFSGVWHYENIKDFEYNFRIYTPLEGFEENGIIAKFIYKEGFDFAFGLIVSDIKLGLKVHGASKPPLLKDLNLEKIKPDNREEEVDPDYDYEEENEESEEDALSWRGEIELDTILYPTMKGTLDIDERGTLYLIVASLVLPDGVAEVHDEFDFITHTTRFHIFSPFDALRLLDITAFIELQENFYHANFSFLTSQSHFTAGGDLKLDKNCVDTTVSLSMDSPFYKIPSFRATIRKDFSGEERKILLEVDRLSPDLKNFKFEGLWHYESNTFVKVKGKLETPFEILPLVEGYIMYSRNIEESSASLDLQLIYAPESQIKVFMVLEGTSLTIDMDLPIEGFSKAQLTGKLIPTPNEGEKTLKAILKSDGKSLDVHGNVKSTTDTPVMVNVRVVTPQKDGQEISLMLKIENKEHGFALDTAFASGEQRLSAQGEMSLQPNDWQVNLKAESSHNLYSSLDFQGRLLKQNDGNVSLTLSADTSLHQFEKLRFSGNYLITPKTGIIRAAFDVTQVKGKVDLEWKWIIMENMFGTNASISFPTTSNVTVQMNLKLPPPYNEVHTVFGFLHYTKGYKHWGKEVYKTVSNVLKVRREEKLIDLIYTLNTPKYMDEDTFVAKIFYNLEDSFHKVKLHHQRFVEAFWTNNSAKFDSQYTYETKNLNTQLNGSVVVEIPLQTRHIAKLVYGYKQEKLHTTGYSFIQYNEKKFLEGRYNCNSQESAGFEKDVINIEIDNAFAPLGIAYVHQYEYSGGSGGTNFPTKDLKRAEIFKLKNKTAFHLTGEALVFSKETGQEITLTAIHMDRTVKLKTDYDFLDHEFKQRSVLHLDPHSWASYDITIVNKTNNDKEEEHMELNFAYPKRNFTVLGYYQMSNNSLSSELTFTWDKQARQKTIGASFDWKRLGSYPRKHHAVVSIKHPSFIRDVTVNGQYSSDDKDLIDVMADLAYSTDMNKKLSLSGKLRDNSQGRLRHYNFEVLGSHPATRLDLKVQGQVKVDGKVYETNNVGSYKRSYLPLQTGNLKGRLNTVLKEVEYEKKSLRDLTYLKGKYNGRYPLYLVNGTFIKGRDLNSTGIFYIDLDEKIIKGNINYTPDASESFHMDGKIPDARNVNFGVWRDFEEIRISDVSFYLRLNHSRLVTSKLKWRPEIRSEIVNGIHDTLDAMWNGIVDGIDYWRQYIKSETSDAVNDIWLDAKPIVQTFLDDVSELKNLADDFEEFKVYLNKSYNANEFYIRDIVGITIYIIDEFSLRGHIESLPEIINEIWEVMGESGKAIRKSIIWIIETIKASYKKLVDFINSLLQGDSTAQITALLEKLVEKYDRFIKDLHVAFIKAVENMWNKISTFLWNNWYNFLQKIEPTFIKFIHYLESVVWKASQEILDFLYERKNDVMESPYFSKIYELSQDLDKFYKDIKKNDLITNIRKYTKILYDFLREKYFSMVPFGNELHQIATELIEEFKELSKLPSINYAIQKVNDLYAKVIWLYDSLDLGTRFQVLLKLLHKKLTDITQTALQVESKYREAKTKFIFDPEEGNVQLEQKLPMSWHAFNETPKFEEIPEYRAINEVQNYFIASNTTFWAWYYEYKPYTDPSTQAMIAGTQHIMTFDRGFYEFEGSCSYLLARDFVDQNFTLVITYNPNNKEHTYELALVVGKKVIQVNVFDDSVKVQQEGVGQLPIDIEDMYIYQEAQMLTIESAKGFKMQCNFKFDVCTLTLAGWYFGKTAGLLGTMDNEPSTDFFTSQKTIDKDLESFVKSWAIEPQICTSSKNFAIESPKLDPSIINLCESFFKTRASQFSPCFPVIDPAPFMRMCLNSRDLNDKKEPCTVAVAYMQACLMENTPLRIPDSCVKCQLVDGEELVEGDFRQLEGNAVPQSTDVVFIIEAKECNKNIKDRRNIDALNSMLFKELTEMKLMSSSIVINNNVFTGPQMLSHYFDNIPIGNGSADIFGAIRYASKLLFRPGVSKTFILLPCSNCDPANTTVLIENDITLHILMNDDFRFEKDRVNKIFYGMDRGTAYTKKDSKVFTGSSELRRQVKIPKAMLGYCTPLALETNGTIFTAKKLQSDKKNGVKKFATVFAKRVAKSAKPCSCQTCECTADNNGMSYMECYRCDYPANSFIEFGFDDENSSTFYPTDEDEVLHYEDSEEETIDA